MAVSSRAPTATDPIFDPEDLLVVLDGAHHELRQQIRQTMARPEFTPVLGLPVDEYREKVMEWTHMIAEAGWGVPGFPVQYGGADDPFGNVVSFETLGHSDLSLLVKFGVQFGLWGGAVHQLGSTSHHDAYLKATADGELLGCFAMTEHGHGSNVQALETTASYDVGTEEFIIHTPHDNARKDYIGGAGQYARYAATFAQLIVGGESKGVHCFVVPIRDSDGNDLPGVRTADDGLKAGLNGVDNGMIWFDHVRIPRENLLNRYADVSAAGVYSSSIDNPNKRFFTMLGTLVQGRICIGAASLSAAKNALTIAIRHSLRRVQFGPSEHEPEVPLMYYRTHQRRLLPLLARTYALYFAQQELTARFAEVIGAGDDADDLARRELETLAAGLKAANTWHAMHTIQTCREACGGAGYMAENRFGMLRDDIDIFTTFEGDNTVLTMLCARGLLADYAHEFGDLNPVGMVSFVAGQAVETVAERLFARQIGQVITDWIPVPRGGSNGSDEETPLPDHRYLLELFEWRQNHITASVAGRFRKRLSQGNDSFEVLRDVQDHLLRVGTSYVDTFAFRAFKKVVDECEDPAIRESLSWLLSLFGLSSIEDDKGFYQEHGRLASNRTKQVTREVNDLCDRVAGQASMLVDAFGIPDEVLAAPIGLKHHPDPAPATVVHSL